MPGIGAASSPDGERVGSGGQGAEPSGAAPGSGGSGPERLLHRDFLLLWQGQLVSLFGSQAFSLALLYAVMEATGSAALLGTVAAASMVPGLLLMPLAGAVADRVSRRRVLVACDVVSGVSSLALAGLFFSLSRPPLSVAAVATAAVVDRVVLSFFVPALSAALPDLAAPSRLPAANSLLQATHQASLIAGRAAAGALYARFGAPILFALDGLSFLYAAASTALVRFPRNGSTDPAAARTRQAPGGFQALTGGFRHLRSQRDLCAILLLLALTGLLGQPLFVLLPFYVKYSLGGDAQSYGLLLAAHGAGSALALGAAILRRRKASAGGLALPFLGGGVCLAALGFVRHGWVAASLLLAAGAGFALLNVELQSLVQGSTPPQLRGRVVALVQTVAAASAALGALWGGVAADLLGKNVAPVFGLCGAALAATALALLFGGLGSVLAPRSGGEGGTSPS